MAAIEMTEERWQQAATALVQRDLFLRNKGKEDVAKPSIADSFTKEHKDEIARKAGFQSYDYLFNQYQIVHGYLDLVRVENAKEKARKEAAARSKRIKEERAERVAGRKEKKRIKEEAKEARAATRKAKADEKKQDVKGKQSRGQEKENNKVVFKRKWGDLVNEPGFESSPKKLKIGDNLESRGEDRDDDEELPLRRVKTESAIKHEVKLEESKLESEIKTEPGDVMKTEEVVKSEVKIKSEVLEDY